MVDPGRSPRVVYLHTWASWVRQNAPRLLRLLTLVLVFLLFAPVQAAGRQNVDVIWSNDAPLGGYQLGDFDGDGKTDLFRITGTQWQYSSGGTGPWINLANDATPQNELRFGDFNGDGVTDVFHVMGTQWRYRPSGVGAWINLANDTTPFYDLRFGDFNGDGVTDVFSVGVGGQWRFSPGGSAPYQNLTADASLTVNDLRFGFFDANDVIDVFNRLPSGQWRFSSGGVLGWANLAGAAEIPYSEMAFGDFDGDGITDVFSRQASGQWQYSKSGTAGWTLLASDSTPFSQLRFGDFNGDGITDVFSLDGSNQLRYSNGGVGAWQTLIPAVPPTPVPPNPPATDIASLEFGDFDGDGYTDVFRSNNGQWQYSSRGLGDWVNLAFDSLPLNQLRFGDFNGDGITDVFSVDASGQWRWSDRGVSNWQNLAADPALTINDLRFGDFNGDGVTDVFSREASGQWRYRASGLGSWINLASDPLPLTELAFGDFDGDGFTDVFSIDPITQRGRYSPRGIQSWVNLDVQGIPLAVLRFGDFNGDGRTDIFNRMDSGQWRYLSAGLGSWINVASDPLSITDLRFGDFNGDNRTDVFSIAPDGRWRYSSAAESSWILLGPPTPTTATPTPTGTVTPGLPTPTPAGCYDILFNGDFEFDGGWMFGDSPVQGRYTGAFKQSGLRSMQLGIPPEVSNVQSYSSIRQLLMIPPNTATVTLRWWQWGFSDEGANPSPSSHQDRLDVIALSPGGDPIRILHRTRSNDNGWRQVPIDMTDMAGKSFYLYFNLYNDGHGGRSWIFLDNMVMEVCPGSGPVYGGGGPKPGGPSWGGPNQGGPKGGGPNMGGPQGPSKPKEPWGTPPIETPTPMPTQVVEPTPTPTITPTVTSPVGADLSLSKSVSPTQVVADGQVRYTLVVTNSGPMSATNVSVMDVLPPGIDYVSSSGTYSNVQGIWTIGTMLANRSATLEITATVQLTASGPITNYAQIWTSDAVDPDSEPADNSPNQDDDDTAVLEVLSAISDVNITLPTMAAAPPAALPISTPATNPSSAQCVELVTNGDFEQTGVGWTLLQGPAAPIYTAEQTFNNSGQAMRLGITDGENLASISAIDQLIQLPAEASSIILSFRYFPLYDSQPGPGDLQYVDMYNVMTGQFAGRALGTQLNDRTWLTADFDMTMQAGQTIRLVLAVNNDGVMGRSAMFVDNVSIIACDFGALVAPGASPLPDSSLGVNNRNVANNQPTIQLDSRNADVLGLPTWTTRISAMAAFASIIVVIGLSVGVVMLSWRRA